MRLAESLNYNMATHEAPRYLVATFPPHEAEMRPEGDDDVPRGFVT